MSPPPIWAAALVLGLCTLSRARIRKSGRGSLRSAPFKIQVPQAGGLDYLRGRIAANTVARPGDRR